MHIEEPPPLSIIAPLHRMSEPSPPAVEGIPSISPLVEQNDIMDPMLAHPSFPGDSSLADFLEQIMVPFESPANAVRSSPSYDALERDVLNFGIEDGVDFQDFDFGLLNSSQELAAQPVQQLPLDDLSGPPSRADDGQGATLGSHTSDAFRRSLWQWIPGILDQGQCEQLNLSLPSNIGVPAAHTKRPCLERLSQSARDKIMAMVTSTCDSSAVMHIVSQFPSVTVLDCLIQDFLFLHQGRAVSFLHIPTFAPNDMTPELVAMTAASGAVLNSVPVVRKLGFALQEAVRLTLPKTVGGDPQVPRAVHS